MPFARPGLFGCVAPLAVFLALAGCGVVPSRVGSVGYGQGYAVAVDEQSAAQVAQDILSAGGTAADAAVATAFALSVSDPASAGLGGGGVCLVYDRVSRTAEALEFIAAAGTVGPETTRPSSTPALVRGMSALHAKRGRVPWESLLAPAETLAREGVVVSASLGKDLAAMAEPLRDDPETRRIFSGSSGRMPVEGEVLIQSDLAALLGGLRLNPDEMYAGPGAQRMAEAARGAGGSLALEDLGVVRPRWGSAIQVRYGGNVAYFPPPPSAGGVAAQMWAMLTGDGGYRTAPPNSRSHLIAEVELRALADRGRWMQPDGGSRIAPAELVAPRRISALANNLNDMRHVAIKGGVPGLTENPSASGFVVADRAGNVVACDLSLNNLFGTGRIAPGTGVFLGAAPHKAGRGPFGLASMIVTEHDSGFVTFAATGVGGGPAAAAMVSVAAKTLIDNSYLADALAAPRLHSSPLADVTLVERSDHPALEDSLRARGHAVVPVGTLGRVNALTCPFGLNLTRPCAAGSDPRAAGFDPL